MHAVKIFARLDLDQICEGPIGARPFLDEHQIGTGARPQRDVKRGFTKIDNQAKRRIIIGNWNLAKRKSGTIAILLIAENSSSSRHLRSFFESISDIYVSPALSKGSNLK
jgi:hypothetical protein